MPLTSRAMKTRRWRFPDSSGTCTTKVFIAVSAVTPRSLVPTQSLSPQRAAEFLAADAEENVEKIQDRTLA